MRPWSSTPAPSAGKLPSPRTATSVCRRTCRAPTGWSSARSRPPRGSVSWRMTSRVRARSRSKPPARPAGRTAPRSPRSRSSSRCAVRASKRSRRTGRSCPTAPRSSSPWPPRPGARASACSPTVSGLPGAWTWPPSLRHEHPRLLRGSSRPPVVAPSRARTTTGPLSGVAGRVRPHRHHTQPYRRRDHASRPRQRATRASGDPARARSRVLGARARGRRPRGGRSARHRRSLGAPRGVGTDQGHHTRRRRPGTVRGPDPHQATRDAPHPVRLPPRPAACRHVQCGGTRGRHRACANDPRLGAGRCRNRRCGLARKGTGGRRGGARAQSVGPVRSAAAQGCRTHRYRRPRQERGAVVYAPDPHPSRGAGLHRARSLHGTVPDDTAPVDPALALAGRFGRRRGAFRGIPRHRPALAPRLRPRNRGGHRVVARRHQEDGPHRPRRAGGRRSVPRRPRARVAVARRPRPGARPRTVDRAPAAVGSHRHGLERPRFLPRPTPRSPLRHPGQRRYDRLGGRTDRRLLDPGRGRDRTGAPARAGVRRGAQLAGHPGRSAHHLAGGSPQSDRLPLAGHAHHHALTTTFRIPKGIFSENTDPGTHRHPGKSLLSRHHDVRTRGEPGPRRLPAHHPPGSRRRHQLPRHG
ncbi:hypothetical protein SGPA1_22072 [Streptomyces misionensis JCM 4497]